MNNAATLYVFRLMYALRLSLSFAMAWVVSYYCDLDRPYWALMTVIVVSMPGQGAMIAKFFARLAGTLFGAVIVNVIAAYALGDPWLMSFWLIAWLALCTYATACHTGMPAYAFALSGYTGAILGFALSVNPSPYVVYYFTQARMAEICLGLACALLASFLLPSSADRRKLETACAETDKELSAMLRKIVFAGEDGQEIRDRFEGVSKLLVETKQLALQDAFAPAVKRNDLSGCVDASSAKLHMLAQFFPLRSLHASLEKNAATHYAANVCRDAAAEWFALPNRNVSAFPAPPASLLQLPAGRQYASLLRETVENIARYQDQGTFPPEAARLPNIVYRDHTEATLNTLRLVVSMLAGVAFWLWTQWDIGYMLPVLIGVSFSLGVTYPRPDKLVFLVIAAALLGIGASAAYQFIIYIQVDALEPVMLVTLPCIFITGYLKSGSMVGFIFWHIATLSMIFLNAYENMMSFDFSRFVNVSVAAVFAACAVAFLLQLLPLSNAATKLNRMKKDILNATDENARPLTANDALNAESLIYSAIAQTTTLDDENAKKEFIAFAVETLEAIRRPQTLDAAQS